MTERMKDLDGQLRDALRREEPPDGFAERVLNRVAEPPIVQQSRPGPFGPGGSQGPALHGVADGATRLNLSFIHWAAAAALVAAVAGGFDYVARQTQRAEGEAAKERVVQALHIAGNKLQLVQTKINRLHEQPDKNSNR